MTPITRMRGEGALWACGPRDPHLRLHSIRRTPMIQSISLKKLVPSPRNVRKSSDDLADLQLRADIAARGLLQNLVVRKRSEEHTSELQSLMRISYAVFCFNKKKQTS